MARPLSLLLYFLISWVPSRSISLASTLGIILLAESHFLTLKIVSSRWYLNAATWSTGSVLLFIGVITVLHRLRSHLIMIRWKLHRSTYVGYKKSITLVPWLKHLNFRFWHVHAVLAPLSNFYYYYVFGLYIYISILLVFSYMTLKNRCIKQGVMYTWHFFLFVIWIFIITVTQNFIIIIIDVYKTIWYIRF